MKRWFSSAWVALIACSGAFAQVYRVAQFIPLGGVGAWDYPKADSEARRLYVSHSGEVLVLDLDTRKVVGKLTGFGFIHGIVIVKELQTGFLSDSQKNEVIAFDPSTLTIKGRIKTSANPNSMAYDAASGRLFVGHKPSKSMTVIRTSSLEIEKIIPLGGIPEFPVSDTGGNVYVNIDDTSEIVQIDARSLAIKARWPLKPCQFPSGLALDAQKHRLFAACDNRLLAVVDAATGKLIATVSIGKGPDAAGFDPNTRVAFRRTAMERLP